MAQHDEFKNYRECNPHLYAEVIKCSQGLSVAFVVPKTEVVFILRGSVLLSFGDAIRERIGSGRMALLPSGAHVSVIAEEDTDLLICRYHDEIRFCERLGREELARHAQKNADNTLQIATLEVNEPLQRFVEGFRTTIEDGLTDWHYISLKLDELMMLIEYYYDTDSLAAFFRPLLVPDQMFRNFVYLNINRCRSIAELQQMCNMSYSGFWSRFRRVIGESPRTFMVREKSNNVKYDLLYSDLPIKEISEKYGFSSVQVFTAFCKNNLGNTPGRVRKEHNFYTDAGKKYSKEGDSDD